MDVQLNDGISLVNDVENFNVSAPNVKSVYLEGGDQPGPYYTTDSVAYNNEDISLTGETDHIDKNNYLIPTILKANTLTESLPT